MMKALIIAAGRGKRMGQLTETTPKCLLKVGSTTLLDNLIARFHQAHIEEVAIIAGYQAEKILAKKIPSFVNAHFETNNILHSLMYAKSFINSDIVISYSDIWLEQAPLTQLLNTPGDCVISVDSAWEENYIGRSDHPVSEAENVLYDEQGRALLLGKHLQPNLAQEKCGEFRGLFKLSRDFCATFISVFEELNKTLDKNSPFQFSQTWHNAYLTDFFNELIKRNHLVTCSITPGGWQEMDTLQDYECLKKRLMEKQYVF